MTDLPEPRWSADPALTEYARRAMEEFERELDAHEPLGPPVPDPVVIEVFTNERRRELRLARDDLDRARVRYETAIRETRAVGYSWGEIGTVLGVSRQQLHRRFR